MGKLREQRRNSFNHQKVDDGDEQAEGRHRPKQLACRSCPESLLYFRSFLSSSARPSAESSGSSKEDSLYCTAECMICYYYY